MKKHLSAACIAILMTGCGTAVPKSEGINSTATKESITVTETNSEEESTENEESFLASDESSEAENTEELISELYEAAEEKKGLLQSAEDLQLYDNYGTGTDITFVYDGDTYSAEYTPDNWKIIDSYTINCKEDMVIICEALSEIHPIHGSDGVSFRTPEDMAAEWIQHNIAYKILSEDDPWKYNAKDVDINPADQNKTIYEMYKSRTGKELY